jgi:hypothetical protein
MLETVSDSCRLLKWLAPYDWCVATPIATRESAARLCREILDAERTTPIVGVCLAEGRDTPLVDVDLLRGELIGRASVHVVCTGEATWEIKRLLPPGLDVYGDALRVWQPGVRSADAGDHPLLLLDEGSAPSAVARHAIDLVDRGTQRERAAVVSDVRPEQATLRLPDGELVVAPRREISRHELAATQVLRPAQAVRVLIIADPLGGAPARGSLLPFEPDGRRRLAEGYGAGSLLLGRVIRLHRFGAFVELLPGLAGLLRVGRIASHWVAHPGDVLTEGELVRVRVLEMDGDRVELSMRGIDAAAHVEAASIHPDGPPWLVPPPPATELPALDEDDDAIGAWEAGRVRGPSPADPLGEISELDRLEDLVLRAADARDRSRQLIGDSVRRVAQLRAEAGRLRHELETDLAELRNRVLRTVEQEHDLVQGSTQEALEVARGEIRRLRAMLAEAERDRDELDQRVRETAEQARRSGEALRAATTEAARHRGRARELRHELDAVVPAEQRLRTAIRTSWLRHTTRADRERYRWREPIIGPEFLASLDLLEGVSRERVVDVCAEVVSGRAPSRPGQQVHPLRATTGGPAPQRVRADGARAYRASLQTRSSAARRLHYWELPDGGVELAKVGYHDDFTIR